jgi:hypothetical protein
MVLPQTAEGSRWRLPETAQDHRDGFQPIPPKALDRSRALQATPLRFRGTRFVSGQDPTLRADQCAPLKSAPHPDLIQMIKQIRWILINPVCASSLQFVRTVSSRKKTHPQSSRPSSGQQVPNAITNDN